MGAQHTLRPAPQRLRAGDSRPSLALVGNLEVLHEDVPISVCHIVDVLVGPVAVLLVLVLVLVLVGFVYVVFVVGIGTETEAEEGARGVIKAGGVLIVVLRESEFLDDRVLARLLVAP